MIIIIIMIIIVLIVTVTATELISSSSSSSSSDLISNYLITRLTITILYILPSYTVIYHISY